MSNNRFIEMDRELKNESKNVSPNGIALSFSNPPALQDITHAGPYRIAYDRLGKLGVIEKAPNRDNRKFHGTSGLQTALNNWTPFLDKVLSSPAYILTGGMTVQKPGQHGIGNAIDVDGFWWSDTNEFLADNATTNWCLYLRIEAGLRKVFGTVLNHDYNADHHDHWHCDIGTSVSWRKVKSQALFAQRALNVFWGEALGIDGDWGRLSTEAMMRRGYDFSKSGEWDRFLDDVIAKQCATQPGAAVAQSFSNEKRTTNQVSQKGIDFIKGFEGFKSSMYNDPAGHCTIGYGNLIHHGKCNGDASEDAYRGGITEEKASKLMLEKLNEFQLLVNQNVIVELNSNQFDSLVSFCYNVGGGNFKSSTLLKLLNKEKYAAVPAELKKWTKARINGVLQDLDGLVKRRDAEAALFAAPTMSIANSIYENYSVPFYDTGEHAILGEFINTVVSGPISTVPELQPGYKLTINNVDFTYGQIITMGDFYEDYKQLKSAGTAELNNLKALIERSENNYKNSIFNLGLPNAVAPTDEDWDKATSKRYLDLAARNNSHFAPPPPQSIFKSSTKPNNKTEWNNYHNMAIQTARGGKSSNDLKEAYKINAFGDHFLTDAFSSGHLINKELVMSHFNIMFLPNGKLDQDSDKFFDVVADKVFVGDVKSLFSQYEFVQKKYGINWDLDRASRFAVLLKEILQSAPDEIGNLAVKAVHDALNKYPNGVPVKNKKGQTWNLFGDGTLNVKDQKAIDGFKIIQQAVKQSVTNVLDSVSSKTAVATYQQNVWDYVPDTSHPATEQIVKQITKEYTNPLSKNLIDKTVELIKEKRFILLDKLKDKKVLQKASFG